MSAETLEASVQANRMWRSRSPVVVDRIPHYQEGVVSPVQGAFVRQGALVMVNDAMVEQFNSLRAGHESLYPERWTMGDLGGRVWVQQKRDNVSRYVFHRLNASVADVRDGNGSIFVMVPDRHQDRRVLVCGRSVMRYLEKTRDRYREPEVQSFLSLVRLLGLADLMEHDGPLWRIKTTLEKVRCDHHVPARNEVEKARYSRRNRGQGRSAEAPVRGRECEQLFWRYSPTAARCTPPPSTSTIDMIGLYNVWVRDDERSEPLLTRLHEPAATDSAPYASDRQIDQWYAVVRDRVFRAGGLPVPNEVRWKPFVDPATSKRLRLPDLNKGRIVRTRMVQPLNQFAF